MANPTYTGEQWASDVCLNEIARAKLPALVGGKLPVDATVTVDTLTVSEVKLLDSAGTNKATINASGEVYANVRVSALPTGASTAAKQPALGTAGASSTDVISVQGIASGTALPVSAASLPLPSSASTSTKQSDGSQKTQVVDGSGNVIGATSNALDVNIKSGNATTTAATQSGTWTVQPGNTANTTAWKVDGSAVTQPVSGTVSVTLPTTSRTLGGAAAVTTGGTITNGKFSVVFLFSSDFVGTIAGTTFTGANDRYFETPTIPAGNTYGAIVYTVASGSMRIIPIT